ncbi:MAG: Dabb family protein [Calditrichia bacterium]
MIKHIVMWKMKKELAGNEKNAALSLMKSQLEGLKEDIPLIRFLEVGLNFNKSDAAYDIVLVTDFQSKEDLNAYQVHPAHQKVVEFVRSVTEKRVVVDYEV